MFFLICHFDSKSQNSDLLLLMGKEKVLPSEESGKLKNLGKERNRYNPFFWGGKAMLFFYQHFISQQIMANCGFEPSCSSFAKEALKSRGFFVGIMLSADRLSRCNGSAQFEAENFLVNRKTGKLRDAPSMYRLGP